MKNNKEELKKQAEKLQKDPDALKVLIEKEDTIDLFKITSYKEVCKALDEQEYTENNFENTYDCEKLLAFAKLKQIERLYNGNWVKDWSNKNQYKYYPYFTLNSSGGLVFSFSCHYCFILICCGQVGFFKDQKTSDYIGKTFISIYEKLK